MRLLLDQDQPRGTGRLATWFAGRARRGDTCQESAQRNSLSPAVDLDFILMEIYSEEDWGVFFYFGVWKGVSACALFSAAHVGSCVPNLFGINVGKLTGFGLREVAGEKHISL